MDGHRPTTLRGSKTVHPGSDPAYRALSSAASRSRPSQEESIVNDSAPTGGSGSSYSGTRHQQRPKRIACKECRQAKLRCDGLRSRVGPCIRCRRLSLGCEVDTTYKRVNKRLKINELVEELEQLRSVVGERNSGDVARYPPQPLYSNAQHQSPKSLPSPASASSVRQGQSGGFQLQRETISSTMPVPPVRERVESVSQASLPSLNEQRGGYATSSERSIEHVELQGSQIDHLFRSFFNHYHPFFEILNESITPDMYYARSPVLFWVIISIAARRYEDDATLLGSLEPCVRKLVWSSASQLPLPSHTIQALLLLCMWSFPVDTQWKDPSFLLISLAKSAAMQNGLQRPETMQDFLRVKTRLEPEEFHEAVKLWTGCFIAAESVTTCVGQPSLFSDDRVIDRACEEGNSYTVPDNLRYYLLTYKFISRVNKVMAERTRSPIGQPTDKESDGLMRLLECDFKDLEKQIGDKIGDVHRIALSMVCLQLRTYYFFESSVSKTRKDGLLRAYTTALDFISKLATADAKMDFIRYAPNVFCLMLNTAGMLVMKIINSSYSRYVDIEGGKLAFNKVLSLLRRASLEDNDVRGRGGKILAQLWTVHYSRTFSREQEPSLNIKSRFGSSVLHDGLWVWREEFGGQSGPPSGPSHPVSNPAQLTPSPSPATLFQPPRPIPNPENIPANNEGRVSQEMEQQYIPDTNFNNLNDLAADISNLDWVWDIGFPSLLPIDIDSYPPFPPASQGVGNDIQ